MIHPYIQEDAQILQIQHDRSLKSIEDKFPWGLKKDSKKLLTDILNWTWTPPTLVMYDNMQESANIHMSDEAVIEYVKETWIKVGDIIVLTNFRESEKSEFSFQDILVISQEKIKALMKTCHKEEEKKHIDLVWRFNEIIVRL